jgi:enoyl-CoA hydratase/carnithine racemase
MNLATPTIIWSALLRFLKLRVEIMNKEKTAYFEDLGDRLIIYNANVANRNAITEELYDVISKALDLAAATDRVRSVIFTGAGTFFCAGGDLNRIRNRRFEPLEDREAHIENLHDIIRKFRACPKPVIAAVEGGAAGAGVSLAYACDFIVASREARFTVSYVRVGLTPDGGITHRLMKMLPRPLVNELCLFAEPIAAERLYQLGALNQLVEPGETMSGASAIADRLATSPTSALSRIKELLNAAEHSTFEEQMDLERDHMAAAVAEDPAVEGITAFFEKRKPDFAKPGDS